MAWGADAVPNDALREYFLLGVERGDWTANEIAERLGWIHRTVYRRGWQGDGGRVARALGAAPYYHGGRHVTQRVSYEKAVALCRAMGMDPVDAGV